MPPLSSQVCAPQTAPTTVTFITTETGAAELGTTGPGTAIIGTEYTTTRAC